MPVIRTSFNTEKIDFERYNHFQNLADSYNIKLHYNQFTSLTEKYKCMRLQRATLSQLYDMFYYRIDKDCRIQINEIFQDLDLFISKTYINRCNKQVIKLPSKIYPIMLRLFRLLHWEIQKCLNPIKEDASDVKRS